MACFALGLDRRRDWSPLRHALIGEAGDRARRAPPPASSPACSRSGLRSTFGFKSIRLHNTQWQVLLLVGREFNPDPASWSDLEVLDRAVWVYPRGLCRGAQSEGRRGRWRPHEPARRRRFGRPQWHAQLARPLRVLVPAALHIGFVVGRAPDLGGASTGADVLDSTIATQKFVLLSRPPLALDSLQGKKTCKGPGAGR